MSNELFPGKYLFVDEHRIESMVAIDHKPSYRRSSGDRLRRHVASMYFPVSSAAVIATDPWSKSKSARRLAGLATSAGNTRMSRIPLATAIRSPRVRSSLASSPRFRSSTFLDRFSLVCGRHSSLNKIGTGPSRRKTISTSGGKDGITDWKAIPYSNYSVSPEIRPKELYWYFLPDGKNIACLFRNNAGKSILRSFSTDDGRSWTPAVVTNFPDASSKCFSVKASNGDYAMVSNARPEARYPLCLSLSKDGLVYQRMAVIDIPEKINKSHWYARKGYPHSLSIRGSSIPTCHGA